MSLTPLFRDFCDELDHFQTHFFEHFPMLDFGECPISRWFDRPLCSHSCCDDSNKCCKLRKERTCCPRVSVGKDGIEMSMNVKQFNPEELSVKTLDNMVQIEGKHNERNDKHGAVSRQFIRRYTLPRGYDPEQVMSTLSPEGVLVVKAPAPPKIPEITERIVPINRNTIMGSPKKK